jgi:hypothetical protein
MAQTNGSPLKDLPSPLKPGSLQHWGPSVGAGRPRFAHCGRSTCSCLVEIGFRGESVI